MADVYHNDQYIGKTDNPTRLVEDVRFSRRRGELDANINIAYNEDLDEVYIQSGKGRLRRPLILVKDGKPLITEQHLKQIASGDLSWNDLVGQGIVEYLDALEEENSLVAFKREDVTKNHTHLEIAPFSMFGLTTALVPYANYSAAAKVNTGSKNQKQALGLYTATIMQRVDMDTSMLQTPQNPILKTVMHDIMGYEHHPSGQNIVIAVMSYRGYNMEDAIILNKGSIDRGFARSTYYRLATSEELRYSGGLYDQIELPDKEINGYRSEKDYRYLEDDGIIYPEAFVKEGDVVIGKTSPPRFLNAMEQYSLGQEGRRESSFGMKHGEEGIIDQVIVTENPEGNKLVQVKIRDQRIPEIGDKFTSRHGQKGIVGLIVEESDMPFTSTGIKPDIIFSPHGIPSRMTISHLIELVAAKAGAMAGREIDGTAFEPESEKDLRDELMRMGFREDGTETLYDGITGDKLDVKIFIGPMYYLKLKHMVSNTLHARARGPIQLLTRQPTEGRAKEGGLRLGEMEKDTFVAHGTASLLKERFDSDKVIVPVDETSGLLAIYDEYKRQAYSQVSGDAASISYVEMSYAFKLLLDELKALGIYPKIMLKSKF
ncbi:MAG: DNA-directed RNA polymerase subunit B [Candidatus Woesearchaeota archaeon]